MVRAFCWYRDTETYDHQEAAISNQFFWRNLAGNNVIANIEWYYWPTDFQQLLFKIR